MYVHTQVDAKLNVISSCNYDGTGRNLVLHSTDTLRHPFSITTFEDYVYWTDWDKEAVFRANKFNGKDVEPVTALHMVRDYILRLLVVSILRTSWFFALTLLASFCAGK